ncbi:MAG TPA: hypothetical protein VJ756_02110 [Terriglobales bacterium]|nr:hypothetical protein [Terriglobales bacterium]
MATGIKAGALANAGRGIQQAGITNQLSGTLSGRGNRTYNTLFPTLQKNLINPQGFGKDLGAINTANQQSIGGSEAGAVGQGNLTAARTRNAAGFAPALDEAMRSGGRQLSQTAADVQTQNALVKQQQQQDAIKALSGLYGENMIDTLRALGLSNDALGTSNQALNVANTADANKMKFTGDLLNTILGGAQQGATMGLKASAVPGF